MHCEHAGCHCSEATVELEGKKYCSEKCAESGNESASRSSAKCSCGHPDCAAL
jgi:hypothetical protein